MSEIQRDAEAYCPRAEKFRAEVERLKDLLRRSDYEDAVCVCHLRMGGCWPCEVRAALDAEQKEVGCE